MIPINIVIKRPCIKALYELSYLFEPMNLDIVEFVPCPIESPTVFNIINNGPEAPNANVASIFN